MDKVQLRIDRAVYLVDDETRTYRFLRRNLDWEKLDPDANDWNKRQIDGYTRIFKGGSKKVVFLSHCILNENTRYLGGACRGGCIREIINLESITVNEVNMIVRRCHIDGEGIFTTTLQAELRRRHKTVPIRHTT